MRDKRLSANTAAFAFSCVAGGFVLIYSNDYGVSSWFCASVIIFIAVCCRTKSALKAAAASMLYAVLSVLTAVLCMTVISHGHVADWIMTMRGVKDYQGWYYAGGKCHSLLQADFSLPRVAQGLLCVHYIARIRSVHGEYKAGRKYYLPLLFNATALCAAEEYRLFSGGTFTQEPNMILFFSVLYGVYSKVNTKYVSRAISVIAAAAAVWVLPSVCKPCMKYRYRDDGLQFKALGGNNIDFAADIRQAEEFLDGKRVFSTYSSAIEADTGTFQPSGYDYIIHVLGDNARSKYMASFRRGDFDYVATMAENTPYDFSDWEVWVRGANWFFYRELYRGYKKVLSTSYQTFWQKAAGENVLPFTVTLECEQIDDATVKITGRTDSGVYGTADCLVEYDETVTKGKGTYLVLSPYIETHGKVCDALLGSRRRQQLHMRRNKGSAGREYIPIEIADGYGEMILTSQPKAHTKLHVFSASCETLFSERLLTREERNR